MGMCKTEKDGSMQSPRHPRDMVSWDDAQVYLQWLTIRTGHVYRLPSEAEWEYAARGGTTTPYWWGHAFIKNQANCDRCGPHRDITYATPGGAYPANPFGLYDVLGNLSEWVADCWNPRYEGAPVDGSAWLSGRCDLRVIRGGSRYSRPEGIKSAYRYRIHRTSAGNNGGFRVVRELP